MQHAILAAVMSCAVIDFQPMSLCCCLVVVAVMLLLPSLTIFPWTALVVLQSFLVAVVIPEKKEIQSFAKQQGISGDYSDILMNDKVPRILPVLMRLLCLQLPSPHS